MERDTSGSPVSAPSEENKPGSDLQLKDHILMVNDLERGEKYYQAMKAKIRPGDVVLEVGTGAGLLSCFAARLGAKHVYTVEQSPVLYRVAQKVLAANGLTDKVTILHCNSKDLASLDRIKEPIDVFVTETIGTQGLDEGILLVFEHVKPFLAPNARIIPESVTFKHCLVNMSGIREQVQIVHPVFDFDLSALNAELKSNTLYWMQPLEPWREISNTVETKSFDMLDFKAVPSRQELEIIANNVCDGMLTWADFRLSDEIRIETRNRYVGASWANSVHFMDRMLVMRGQVCSSDFAVAEDRFSWHMTWHIDARRS
jgi:precorrin-6B methylase 2